MRLTVLVTGAGVPPGLMSWAAWTAVAGAPRRVASSESALVHAVQAAGHAVEVLPATAPADVLGLARDGDVVWLADAEESAHLVPALVSAPTPAGVAVTVLRASYDVAGARLLELVEVMDRLRRECPWDREQTHRSLARYLLEETYETLEAIESGDPAHLCEELGDLLLQVVFHARVASEAAAADACFDVDDVAGGIVDKLVHRHPHVFSGVGVDGVAEVESNWETLKAVEKGRASVLDGIPPSLPALALADKVAGRAARLGVQPARGTGVGDRLLDLVLQARAAGVDPEQALRDAVRLLGDAVRAAESAAPRG